MLRRIEKIFVDVATIAIILLAVIIFVDVIALNIFSTSVPDAVVIVRELMVVAIIMPLAAVTMQRANISVEFVTNNLPKRIVDWFIVFGSFFALFALTPLLFSAYRDLIHQLNTGSAFYGDLNLPQWPGRIAFCIGILLCWVRLLVMVIQDSYTILRHGSIEQ
jgi:TRAP-type C4-dicarboxylate transport system permease small subunit